MPRRKPAAASDFHGETMLALTDEHYVALSLWSIVRRRRGKSWGADFEQWCRLAHTDAASLERLLGIMQGGQYIRDDGELRPEVLDVLHSRLAQKLTPKAGKP